MIAVGGCEPDWGACVEHYRLNTDGGELSWDTCREDHMDGECTGSDEFHPGLSCADVGYPYFCTSAELEQNGLGADDSYLENPGCDPFGEGVEGVTWLDTTWRFVQSDKAVQFRLALVRTEGTRHFIKIQYRVNSGDPIYCPDCNGYHVFVNTPTYKYKVVFPPSFTLPAIYQLEQELEIDVDGTAVQWDEDNRQIVTSDNVAWPYSCVDDNFDGTTRCTSFEPIVTVTLTATPNYP